MYATDGDDSNETTHGTTFDVHEGVIIAIFERRRGKRVDEESAMLANGNEHDLGCSSLIVQKALLIGGIPRRLASGTRLAQSNPLSLQLSLLHARNSLPLH